MPPQNAPKPGSEIEQKLGIDKIEDSATREIVKNHFEKTLTEEQQKGLIHEKSKMELAKLQEKIKSLNARHAAAEEFVREIIKTMQQDVLERDLHEGYTDAKGEHKGYIESYFQQAGTDIHESGVQLSELEKKYKNGTKYDIDWDDRKTFETCRERVVGAILALPLDVKRDVRHRFAQDFIDGYTSTLNNFDWPGEKFDFDEINNMENQFKEKYPHLQNFKAWLERKGIAEKDSKNEYSELDTKALVDIKSKFAANRNKLGEFSQPQKDFYTQQINDLEALALTNPTRALELQAAMEKDMAALTTLVVFGKEIGGLKSKYDESKAKYNDFDNKFEGQIADLQKDYDAQIKKLDTEKDPQKRAALMDVAGEFKKIKEQKEKLEFDLTKATEESAKKKEEADKQAGTAPGATPETAPDDEDDKPGIVDKFVLKNPKLQQFVKELAVKFSGFAGFILNIFLAKSTLKALGVTAPTDLEGFLDKALNEDEKKTILSKAKKVLKDNFKIEKEDELKPVIDVLTGAKVKDFLEKKPEKLNKERYDAFVLLLKSNGATANTDETVFKYLLTKITKNEWKP